ncbi:hypothetical protein M1D52_20155 [Olivibacter sp. SA151]|uniref:hypothetical protein n=1 Tax=Olivibacter jilunii TaxID=985016 RepID=UPI003F169F00
MEILYLYAPSSYGRKEDKKAGKFHFQLKIIYAEKRGDGQYNFYDHESCSVTVIDQFYWFIYGKGMNETFLSVHTMNDLMEQMTSFGMGFRLISARNYHRLRRLFVLKLFHCTEQMVQATGENRFLFYDSQMSLNTIRIVHLNRTRHSMVSCLENFLITYPQVDVGAPFPFLTFSLQAYDPRSFTTFEDAYPFVSTENEFTSALQEEEYRSLRRFILGEIWERHELGENGFWLTKSFWDRYSIMMN